MVTQKEIAKRLGVSRSTVVRALNDTGPVKAEIKRKILKLSKELNYEKNYIGKSLALQKEKKVFAFVVRSKNIFYTDNIIRGFSKIAKEFKPHNFNLEIIETDIGDVEGQIKELDKVLETDEVDGIIIVPLDRKRIFEKLAQKPKIKVITYGIKLAEDILYIGPDYYKQGRIAADILANMLSPKSSILLIDNGDDKVSSKQYMDGYLSRIKETDFNLIGPIYAGTYQKAIALVEEHSDSIAAIYVNRYAQDLFMNIDKKYIEGKKIVINGMGKRIQELIRTKKITATVMEKEEYDAYLAGKTMFDILYRNIEPQEDIISVNRIVFFENLAENLNEN